MLDAPQREAVQRMNARLQHRGPDSMGHVASPFADLAMRRLAIVDLMGGHQPFVSPDGQLELVCNGEVYNHVALRNDLEAKGHRFSSGSDIEVILHAYAEHGIQCLRLLRGMFAFALADHRRRVIWLGRDRMGEKPLYYHQDSSGALWFSSEIRSLMQAPGAPSRISAEAFNFFLTFQYVPEPAALLSGLRQLPAAHVLAYDICTGKVEERRYWFPEQIHADPGHPERTVRRAIDSACALMGTADVPVAVALSGGIDSSLVAALTARHHRRGLHAFSIGYTGRPASDERNLASGFASQLGIDFTEIEVSDGEVLSEFPDLIAAMDTPIADIAAYGYYRVCRAAREHGFPVLLSGIGGDELFWGYGWVREAMLRNESAQAQTGLRYLWARARGRVNGSRDFFGVHPVLRTGDAWSRRLMTSAALSEVPPSAWLHRNSLSAEGPLHLEITELLCRTWLRSNCLALMDRMSMAHSVEVRLPLLDVVLAEDVIGMRNAGVRDWRLPCKALLKGALHGLLPAHVLRRRKRGFSPPAGQWMQGIVAAWRSLLPNGALVGGGLISPEMLERSFDSFDRFFQYKLVLLELWSRLHLEHQSADSMRAHAGVPSG